MILMAGSRRETGGLYLSTGGVVSYFLCQPLRASPGVSIQSFRDESDFGSLHPSRSDATAETTPQSVC